MALLVSYGLFTIDQCHHLLTDPKCGTMYHIVNAIIRLFDPNTTIIKQQVADSQQT